MRKLFRRLEDPGILPNGELNRKVQRHLGRRETKTGKNGEERKERRKRKTQRRGERGKKKKRERGVQPGEEERAGTIGTSETASLKREGEPGSFEFRFVLPFSVRARGLLVKAIRKYA